MTSTSSLRHARGDFSVEVTPQATDNPSAKGAGLSRLSLEKRFTGDLDASGQGEMLGAGDGMTAGGYVALERITGTLSGRSGSFAMIHRAIMAGGIPREWTIDVVPESGTEELRGLSGSMKITAEGGRHSYDFAYTLAETA